MAQSGLNRQPSSNQFGAAGGPLSASRYRSTTGGESQPGWLDFQPSGINHDCSTDKLPAAKFMILVYYNSLYSYALMFLTIALDLKLLKCRKPFFLFAFLKFNGQFIWRWGRQCRVSSLSNIHGCRGAPCCSTSPGASDAPRWQTSG